MRPGDEFWYSERECWAVEARRGGKQSDEGNHGQQSSSVIYSPSISPATRYMYCPMWKCGRYLCVARWWRATCRGPIPALGPKRLAGYEIETANANFCSHEVPTHLMPSVPDNSLFRPLLARCFSIPAPTRSPRPSTHHVLARGERVGLAARRRVAAQPAPPPSHRVGDAAPPRQAEPDRVRPVPARRQRARRRPAAQRDRRCQPSPRR